MYFENWFATVFITNPSSLDPYSEHCFSIKPILTLVASSSSLDPVLSTVSLSIELILMAKYHIHCTVELL